MNSVEIAGPVADSRLPWSDENFWRRCSIIWHVNANHVTFGPGYGVVWTDRESADACLAV